VAAERAQAPERSSRRGTQPMTSPASALPTASRRKSRPLHARAGREASDVTGRLQALQYAILLDKYIIYQQVRQISSIQTRVLEN
jgi:hypothetical protein